MSRNGIFAAGAVALAVCTSAPAAAPVSGVDLQYVDASVRPRTICIGI